VTVIGTSDTSRLAMDYYSGVPKDIK